METPSTNQEIIDGLCRRLVRLFNHDEECGHPRVAEVEIENMLELTASLMAAVSQAEQQLIELGGTCPHIAAMDAELNAGDAGRQGTG